jgi:hypothetical protein
MMKPLPGAPAGVFIFRKFKNVVKIKMFFSKPHNFVLKYIYQNKGGCAMNLFMRSIEGVEFHFTDKHIGMDGGGKNKEPHLYTEVVSFNYRTEGDFVIADIEIAGGRYNFKLPLSMLDSMAELTDTIKHMNAVNYANAAGQGQQSQQAQAAQQAGPQTAAGTQQTAGQAQQTNAAAPNAQAAPKPAAPAKPEDPEKRMKRLEDDIKTMKILMIVLIVMLAISCILLIYVTSVNAKLSDTLDSASNLISQYESYYDSFS